MPRDLKSEFYPESNFGGYTDTDGTVAFYTRVNQLARPSDTLIDFGCGRAAYQSDPVDVRRELRVFRGKVEKVIGLDVDPVGEDNPCIDEFRKLDGSRWPLADNSAEICVCDSVVEHLKEPKEFFDEAARVLKPGGYLCIRTPNVRSYFALASRMVPNEFHAAVLSIVQQGRKEEDVFPTFYHCNTIRKMKNAFEQHGFESVVYGFESEPAYLDFSRLAYLLGTLYQRLAPNNIKSAIFAFGRLKP